MKVISTTEAKTNFEKYLSVAMFEPIVVSKTGHVVNVMISKTEYNRLEAYEAAYWRLNVLLKKADTWVRKKVKKIIEQLLNA